MKTDETLFDRYNRLRNELSAAENELEATVLPPVRALAFAGRIDEAKALARQTIPNDSLTWIFALDAFREAAKIVR